MAERVLFVGWTRPVRGMEERAIEAFNEALGLNGRMQQDGRIESFNVTLLDLNNDLGGYIELRGSEAQIAAMRNDEEFQRMMINASMSVEGMRLIDGHCDQGIAKQMTMFQEAMSAAAR